MRAQGRGSRQVIRTRSRCRVIECAFPIPTSTSVRRGHVGAPELRTPDCSRAIGPPSCLISHVPRRQPPTSCPAPPAPPPAPKQFQTSAAGRGRRRAAVSRNSNAPLAQQWSSRPDYRTSHHSSRVPAGCSPASPLRLSLLPSNSSRGLSGLLLRPPGHSLRSPSDICWARLLRPIHPPPLPPHPGAHHHPPHFFNLFQGQCDETN